MSTNIAKAHAAKRKVEEAKQKSIRERVQDLLGDPRVNDELKRKLKYAQDALDGRYPRSDTALMSEVRAKLMQEALRLLP